MNFDLAIKENNELIKLEEFKYFSSSSIYTWYLIQAFNSKNNINFFLNSIALDWTQVNMVYSTKKALTLSQPLRLAMYFINMSHGQTLQHQLRADLLRYRGEDS